MKSEKNERSEKKERLGNEAKKKRAIAFVSVLFYAVMLFLALGARRLHEGSLPHVDVTTPTFKTFSDGEEISSSPALPEEFLDSGRLFVIAYQTVNGEVRTIAKEVTELVLGGLTKDGYREIVNGVSIFSEVIVGGGDGLQDGDEVFVKGEWSGER